MDSHSKLDFHLKTVDSTHSLRGYKNFYHLYNETSGEHRKYLLDCSKDGLSKKKSWVGIFIVARQWGQGEGCHMQEEAYMDFWNSHKCQRRQHPDFLISFSRCKTEEEGEGWQQSNVKNQRFSTNIYNPELHSLLVVYCNESVSRSVVSDSHNPMDCNLPVSPVHGILQVRILEWVVIQGSSWSRDQTRVSCIAGRFFIISAIREALFIAIALY